MSLKDYLSNSMDASGLDMYCTRQVSLMDLICFGATKLRMIWISLLSL